MGQDFELPDEILSVIPTDPFEQLDLARKITSMAINSRVSNLDAEVTSLRQKVYERDRVIDDLEFRASQLQEALNGSELRLKIARDENMKLVKERDTMELTAKKLSRDLAKLEAFKRQLLQSLDDDNSTAETVEISTYDQTQSRGNTTTEEVDGYPTQRSVNGSIMDSAGSADDVYRPRYALTQYVPPRLTPTRTPTAISPSVSPQGNYNSLSPQQTSGTASPINALYDGSGTLSSWFPSSHQSSATNSPGRPLPARPPRTDGKEIFRLARSRLSYEQFSAFLANIKEFNAKRQSREETLRKAEECFGTDNKDLYLSFQSLLSRYTR